MKRVVIAVARASASTQSRAPISSRSKCAGSGKSEPLFRVERIFSPFRLRPFRIRPFDGSAPIYGGLQRRHAGHRRGGRPLLSRMARLPSGESSHCWSRPYAADQPILIPPPNMTLNHFRNASKATAKSTPAEPINPSLLVPFVLHGLRTRLLLYRPRAPLTFHET